MSQTKEQAGGAKSSLLYTGGALIYYLCQWALAVVIVWISGYEAAGVLSLALTVCAAPAIVGLFNVRTYQVSDLDGEYQTRTYTNSRHVTNALSFIVCLIMIAYGGYDFSKTIVIVIFMLYKLAEGTADVYYGIEQKSNRLDVAGISYTLRGIGTIAIFVVLQLLWDNLTISLLAIALFSYGVIWCVDIPVARKLESSLRMKNQFTWKPIVSLLITCIPLAVFAFLNNLAYNFPKIVFENAFGSEAMGYFSSVTSPSMVVQLVATTLFAPLIPPLTESYNKKEKASFFQIIKRFSILAGALSVICIIGAALLGKWILVLIFGAAIGDYAYLFVPSIIVMILAAISTCMYSVCTLVRILKMQYVVGIASFAAAVVLAYVLVGPFSMMGVVYAQGLAILVQVVIQGILIARKLKKNWQ